MSDHDSGRFDRLPETAPDGTDAGRPTRQAVVEFFGERFGLPAATFEGHTFWEKGHGSVWAVAGEATDPIEVETLGLRLLRTGGRHWKPTTNAVQRFGSDATRNVIELDHEAARRFVAGDEQPIGWDGDWGYLIAVTEVAGEPAPLGVGLYTHGELASTVPKARRVELD